MITANWLELNTLKVAVDASPLAYEAKEALNSGDKARSSMLRIQNIIVLNSELERIMAKLGVEVPPREETENVS